MTVQELNTLFGENVKFFRKEMGLTQRQLGKEMGIAQTVISDYELGNVFPHLRQLVMLAYILKVEVWELVYYEGDTN
jgi:transcriptional regulator with XRE-family HTH domain